MSKREAFEAGRCAGCPHLFAAGPGLPVQLCPGEECPGRPNRKEEA
ncbi:MAG: hypothetical protein AB7E47_05885 [Desulfovibrionaceae bacterium]